MFLGVILFFYSFLLDEIYRMSWIPEAVKASWSERRLIKTPRINGLSSQRESIENDYTTNPLGHLRKNAYFFGSAGFRNTCPHCVIVYLFQPFLGFTSMSLAVALNNSIMFHRSYKRLLLIRESNFFLAAQTNDVQFSR